MKDSYVGDIGDFANNGLLRHIFGGPGAPAVDNPLRLGVVSYLNDGAITGYLEGNAPLRECDPGLYKTLQGFVFVFEGVRNRKISTVAYRGMLPDDTIFYDEPLPRARERTADNPWVEGALEEMEDADVVFINPDKGISSDDNHADTEHVSIAELGRFYDKGKSLIIYQHNTQRNGQIEGLAQRLQGWNLPLQWILSWHRITARFYLVVLQPYHQAFFQQRIQALQGSIWCQAWPGLDTPHFTVVRWPPV